MNKEEQKKRSMEALAKLRDESKPKQGGDPKPKKAKQKKRERRQRNQADDCSSCNCPCHVS